MALFCAMPGVSAEAVAFQTLHGHVPPGVKALTPVGRLPATNLLHLAISLPLRDTNGMSSLLANIYNPASTNFHHFLTPAEFTRRFGPTASDAQAVVDFARSNGFTAHVHPNRLLVDITGPAAAVENAFHTTLRVYQHPAGTNRIFYAPDTEPSLKLSVPVSHISGLDNYALPRPQLKSVVPLDSYRALPNQGHGPSGTYMGNDFRAAYVPAATQTGTGQTVGLLEFDGYAASDISYYESQNALPHVALTNVLLDGFDGSASGNVGTVEVCLDIEMAISMAPNLAEVIVYEAGPAGNWHDILNRMATDNLAQQMSCSWSIPGAGADPVADQIFQQMALQGQSFFCASGDSDAYSGLIPFPEDSPYITQVGGTTLTTSGPQGVWISETVWNWGGGEGSGGGISTQYLIPSYQTNLSLVASQGSTTMRNSPDVAMTADNIYVRAAGTDYFTGGTSCAAPLWAGLAALANQQAAATTNPPLGLINFMLAAIYQSPAYASCFHDITTGNNTNSASGGKFFAVTGYDLCTGLGSPAGPALINALGSPEPLQIAPAGLSAFGGAGGPFPVMAQNLSLNNIGTNALNWTLATTASWLSPSSTGGVLTHGAPATVLTLQFNSAASNLAVGSYTNNLWFTNLNDHVGQNRQFTLVILTPPMITSQPSNQTVLEGATTGFNVAATGQFLSYQWQFDGTNLVDGGGISGSSTAALVITNASVTEAGTYNVIVSNAAGTVVSSSALLSIPSVPPGIIQQPTNCTAVIGFSGQFSVAALGHPPFGYQWFYNATNMLAGATNASLTFTNAQPGNAGNYSVIVTNIYGSTISSNALLTVQTPPPAIVTQPANDTVYVGQTAAFAVSAFGPPPLSYQWLFNSNVIAGATNSSFTLPYAQSANVGNYSVMVTDPYGSTISSNASLTVLLTAPCAPVPPNLVAWWKAESNAFDSAGTNTLTLNGGLAYAPGKVGTAFQFNGTGAYLHCPASPGLNVDSVSGSLTIECWICPANITNVQTILDWNNGSSIGTHFYINLSATGQTNGNGAIYFNLGNRDYGSAAGVVNTNGFQHLAVTFDTASGNSAIYYNGSVVASTNLGAGNTPISAYGVYVGQVPPSFYYFDGLMDEVSIYNRALAADEILALYNANSTGKCTMPPAITTQPADQSISAGATASFGVSLSGTYPFFYHWFYNSNAISGATNASYALTNVQPVNAGFYSVVVTNFYGSVASSSARLTVLTLPPAITSQPASLTVNANTAATFTVTAGGTPPFTYQWYYNGIYGISGATNSSLTLSNVQTYNAGNYSVAITNHYGFVLSSNAALTVLTFPPTILTQPTNLTVDANSTATFAVTASGPPPLAYQWLFNATNLIAGATNSSLVFSSAQPFNAGAYSVVITNIYGSVRSSNASLTVMTYPPAIVAQPPDMTLNADDDGTFSVTASGTAPLNYQWLYNGTNRIAGATSSSLQINNAVPANDGTYSVVITNLYGSITSSNALLTVLAYPPTINTQPTNLIVNVNTPAKFSVSASGSPFLKYQWMLNGTNRIAGATSSSLSFASAQPSNSGIYSVLITNLYGSIASSNASLMVQTFPPVIVTQPASLTVSASSNAAFAITASGSSPLNYQWFYNATNLLAGATNTSLSLSNVKLFNSGTYSAMVTNPFGSITSSNALLTVITYPPTIIIQPTNQVSAVHDIAPFTVTVSGTPPFNYQWFFNSNAVAGATNFSLTVPYVQSSNGGNYSVAISNPYGSVTSSNALLTVVLPPACAPAPSNLVTCWKAENNAIDSIGTNNGGSPIGIAYAPGEVGQGFSFTGFSGYISVPNAPSLNFSNQMTVECWIQINSNSNPEWAAIVGKGNSSWRLQVLDGARIDFATTGLANTDLIGNRTVNDGHWHHVAGVWDGTNKSLYVDGTLDSYLSTVGSISQNNYPIGLGRNTDPPFAYYFVGLIDEVSLYDRGLSSNEIYAIYTAASSGKCLPLPVIKTQPLSQLVLPGCNAGFGVNATFSSPLGYQWYRDGTALGGRTNSSLQLTNVQSTNFGNYWVVVTSAAGAAVFSSTAALGPDHVPVANPDTIQRFLTGGVKVPVSTLLANDADADGDLLSITAVSPVSAANGTVLLSGNWVYYTPPAGYTNSDNYTYTLSDGHCGGTSTGNVTVQVQTNTNTPGNLAIQIGTGGANIVYLAGVPGQSYRIQSTGSLFNPHWTDLSTNVADYFGGIQITNPPSQTTPAQYYRAVTP